MRCALSRSLCRLSCVLAVALVLIMLSILFLSRAPVSSTRAAAGTISGTVFQDYNANGARDASRTVNNNGSGTIAVAADRGIAGVTVTAYDGSGAAVGTATTDAQGNYSLNAAGDGPYRVEFTALPAGFRPGPAGTDSKTTVQFVNQATASNVSLGLIIPSEFCQDNPVLATACYVIGLPGTTGLPVVVAYPYSAGSTRETGGAPFADFDSPPHPVLATAGQVGATWGIGYSRSGRRIYTSAFMKKHTAFGPGGTGAIYRLDPTSPASTAVYADLNALFGANTAGADVHDRADPDRDNNNTSWDAVGKNSLGGLAVSEDEKRLYVMNLANRTLYELPLDAAPTASNVRSRAVPTNPPGCANPNDVRPFAVHVNGGQLYVGMVCSAESTITAARPEGDASQLQAYVYTVNQTTLDFSASPAIQVPLNYPRRCADSAQLGLPDCQAAAWRAWSPVFRNLPNAGERGIWPQPMLTDLAFDGGNLILGMRDRAGDQYGLLTLDDPASGTRFYGVVAGDVLRACGSPATGWTLETNGRCGGAGAAPMGSGEGPGGGEFYFGDFSRPFNDENTMGGMVQVPGFPHLAIHVIDPIPIFDVNTLFDGGTRWFSNASGAGVKNYRVYDGALTPNDPFGKANGLGDLIALCEAAPIEIGNRIWRDANGNGIQDAGEPGIAGVRVQLFKNGQGVGIATTDANGEYLFNAANVVGGVLPEMAYEVRVDKTQSALAGLALTGNDRDSGPNGDARDSDATMTGDNAVIAITTGTAGANDHTFDTGFTQQLAITCPPNQTAPATGASGAVVNYPAPTATAGATVTCTPASGSTFPVGVTTVTCTATNAGGSASCTFTVTVSQGAPTITCPPNQTATTPNASGTVVNYPAPTATDGATVVCTPASGANFPVGVTTVTCTATNAAGSASCTFTVTVTQTPPTITCPPNQTATATGAGGAVVNYPAPTATAGATITCTPASGSTFPLGVTTVTCTATNAAGSASCNFTVTVNQAPPTITCPPNQTATTPDASGTAVNYPAPTASDGATVICTPASGSNFPVGVTTVTCTATNSAGSASCTFTVTVTQTPPTITCPPNQTATTPSATGTTVNYPAPTATAGATVACTPASGANFPVGVTTVTCTATNAAGSASCSFTVTVTQTAPVIACPPNQSATTPSSSGTVVTYPAPTTTAGATVACTPASGSNFPVGVTTVTCTATNAAGSASCSFTVTVTQTGPGIACPTNVTTTATSSSGAIVNYPTPTSISGATITCSPASGTRFPIGMTPVTCTATNAAGSSTCGFTVTVEPMMKKSDKCDTLCFRSRHFYLLNLDRLPGGTLIVGGFNNNKPIIASQNVAVIRRALLGNNTGIGAITPLQRLNQEFVAAQLSVNQVGGINSAVGINVMWSMIGCYRITFAPVRLSNGAVISPDSMLNDLFEQGFEAIRENRTADMRVLADLFELLNGNDPRGGCSR
jgi:PKD repeat protein